MQFRPESSLYIHVVFALFLGTLPSVCLGQQVFPRFEAAVNNSLTMTVDGKPTTNGNAAKDIQGSLEGTEYVAPCALDDGRHSNVAGSASTVVTKHDAGWITISFNSDASAKGGHSVSCFACSGNVCVGRHGADTNGSVTATASALVTTTFDPDFPRPSDYVIHITSSAQGGSPSVALTDGTGNPVPLDSTKENEVTLKGKPGQIYYLRVSLPATAENRGGCCETQKTTKATVDVRITKAPIIQTAYNLTGFIKGGRQTTGYKYVGAILLDGQVHCSGTVIGSRTVITAAHCLNGYDHAKMSFIIGQNYQYPDSPPISVSEALYPAGGGTPFRFNPATYEDDIGIIHLSQALAVEPANLYGGSPTWDDILTKHLSLLFVGYGFNVIEGDMTGVGIKREGSWQIDKVENRRIFFSVPGFNTCHGDSGGPAFVEEAGHLLLAAITSGGDAECTQGFETRLDAYMSWITGKII